MSEVTRLLEAVADKECDADRQLTTRVYQELRHIAHSKVRRERSASALNTTELVHEAYLRLIEGKPLASNCRSYFFAAAAEAMRRILVEDARKRARVRRGGDRKQVPFDSNFAAPTPTAGVIELSEALSDLEVVDARKALTVKLRYFAGFSVAESAEALGVSERTLKEDWRIARMWLNHRLRDTHERPEAEETR